MISQFVQINFLVYEIKVYYSLSKCNFKFSMTHMFMKPKMFNKHNFIQKATENVK